MQEYCGLCNRYKDYGFNNCQNCGMKFYVPQTPSIAVKKRKTKVDLIEEINRTLKSKRIDIQFRLE